MFGTLRMFGLCLALMPWIFGHQHKDDLAKYQAKFTQETDPVKKGKLMVRLGRAEFHEIEKDVSGNNLSKAAEELAEYQKQADSVSKALDASGRKAVKNAAGFLQLQISVREALERLNNILVGLTSDQQKPFEDVREDLDELNRHLISELFPSQGR